MAVNLRRKRHDLQMTGELTERVGLGARYADAIDCGDVSPSATVLGQIVEALESSRETCSRGGAAS